MWDYDRFLSFVKSGSGRSCSAAAGFVLSRGVSGSKVPQTVAFKKVISELKGKAQIRNVFRTENLLVASYVCEKSCQNVLTSETTRLQMPH